MRRRNILPAMLTLTLLAVIAFIVGSGSVRTTEPALAQQPAANQASLERLTLGEMVDRAGRIFRGTVISAEPGSLEVGGASLPTMVYKFRVDRVFKGNFETKDGIAFADVTMLGSPKTANRSGNLVKLNSIPAPSLMKVGSDHLILLTPESSVGLTVPVGLGQGNFELFEQDKLEFAKNEFNNAGLFDGPVQYSRLADEILKKGGTR